PLAGSAPGMGGTCKARPDRYTVACGRDVVMGSRLNEIVVDCHDPVAQAAFWAAAFDYHEVHTEDAQVEIAPWEREPPDLAEQERRAPAVPTLVFATVPDGKPARNRVPRR